MLAKPTRGVAITISEDTMEDQSRKQLLIPHAELEARRFIRNKNGGEEPLDSNKILEEIAREEGASILGRTTCLPK